MKSFYNVDSCSFERQVIFGVKARVVSCMPFNACCCYSSLFFSLNVHKNSVKNFFYDSNALRFSVTSVINQHFVNVFLSDHSPLLIFRAVSKHSTQTREYEVRELISVPHDNFFKTYFRSMTYSMAIVRY